MPDETTTTQIPARVALFIHAGWTGHQWHILNDFLAYCDEPGAARLQRWLRKPYVGVATSEDMVPPALKTVMDFFARYGEHAPHLLNAVSAGASERFTRTFLAHDLLADDSPDTSPAVHAWQYATGLGLSEPAATGWAATNYLQTRRHPIEREWSPARGDEQTSMLRQWVTQFGPDAYLWVLAGFTLDEASGLQQGGTVITGQQLRVMAALGGVVLPAGI